MDIAVRDWIAHHARFSPEREALLDLASSRSFTYAEFDARITRAASFLAHELGVGKGERVAVLSHNDGDVFELQFACQRIGAIFLPINWRLAVPEIEFICADASPAALVYDSAFEKTAQTVARACGTAHLVSLANGASSDYEAGLARARSQVQSPDLSLSDTWTLMYTSGTTGRPKGALISYSMGLFNAVQCTTCVDLTSRSKNLVLLPTFHTAGLNVYANPVFHCGGTNIVMRSFEPSQFMALLADKTLGLTHLLGVPTNFLMLAQVPGFAEADFSHIECLGVGGAAAPEALIQTFGAKGLALQQLWGMTETGPLGLALPADKALSKIGSSGFPGMHMELKICDEAGDEVETGATGELLIRGPNVTRGYWNRPEANAQAFTDDGWFRTGDAARIDEDGFYFIVDRWKDMYISGGENVYPAEVENVIYQLDGVLENAVVGIPHETWGEVGRAYVVLKGGANLDADTIVSHCHDNLATFKVPKEVAFLDELPHNATGKVLKHQLSRD